MNANWFLHKVLLKPMEQLRKEIYGMFQIIANQRILLTRVLGYKKVNTAIPSTVLLLELPAGNGFLQYRRNQPQIPLHLELRVQP